MTEIPFRGLVVIAILFGLGGCGPGQLPAPSDTPAQSSTIALSPIDTPTPSHIETPSPSPDGVTASPTTTVTASPTTTPVTASPTTTPVTATPTMQATPSPDILSIPLGVGVYDSNDVALLNKYAREQDVIGVRLPVMNLLAEIQIGQKMLVWGAQDETSADTSSAIAEAKAKGVTLLGYNLETALSNEDLISHETQMQEVARSAGLIYAFAPTLLKLSQNYDDFARHADIIILQAQRYQTGSDYENQVETLIAKIKSANPAVKVWVQVSVNPPENQDITPDQVINDIQLIADKADLVWIFFAPRKVSILEQVLMRLRPSGDQHGQRTPGPASQRTRASACDLAGIGK